MASDESWRWRFKIADQIHQRLWNQLARWIMRKPLSVESEFLSLDSGAASYQEQQPVEIRSRLLQADGAPAEGRKVVAVLWRDGQIVSRVKLPEEPTNPGGYTSAVRGLPTGDYEVSIEADGFTPEALTARTQFAIIERDPSQEMLSTTCNVELLQQLSEATTAEWRAHCAFDSAALAELLLVCPGVNAAGPRVDSSQAIGACLVTSFEADANRALAVDEVYPGGSVKGPK
jgi:hypothetical protein